MEYLHNLGNSNINLVGRRFGTALQSACVAGHLAAFNHLIEWGADVNAKGGEFGTALNAAAAGGQEIMVKCLVNREASLALTDAVGRTPLYLACRNGHTRIVPFLLEAGADMSISNKNGWTPLNIAAGSGHLEVVKLLLDRGADMSISIKDESTPLHTAAHSGHLEVVKLLLDRGADMSISTKDESTPLHAAAHSGHLEVVKLLLDRGADINSKTIFDVTPLHVAISEGKEDFIDTFIRRGADLLIVDIYGRTCLDWLRLLGSHFEKIDQWMDGHDEKLTKNKNIKHLRQSIHDISCRLIEPGKKTGALGFHELGHCLMFMGMLDEAKFAFQQQILMIDDGGVASHDVRCTKCSVSPISGTRWVCQICPDVDMCKTCANKISNRDVHHVCQNHPFLEIPNDNSKIACAQSTSSVCGKLDSWLRTLVAGCNKDETISIISDDVYNFDVPVAGSF